jgi:hypothetical protein
MVHLYLILLLVLLPGFAVGQDTGEDTPVMITSQEHPTGGEGSASKEEPEHPAVPVNPEHPAGQEHPEHPTEGIEGAEKAKEVITIESVAIYLEGYVGKKVVEGGGWMKVQDEKANATLKLKLDKIHRERLAKTDQGTYFVCADFTSPGGKIYDLDFWVMETDEGLKVTETTVHKEDGKPRYSWVEKDGIWSQLPLSDE